MRTVGDKQRETIRPDFDRSINIDFLGAKLRAGNAHSADGVLGLISPLVDRYRSWFNQFWLRGDAAFAGPDLYEFCEKKRITYFIRLPSNNCLKRLIFYAPRGGPLVVPQRGACRSG